MLNTYDEHIRAYARHLLNRRWGSLNNVTEAWAHNEVEYFMMILRTVFGKS